MLTLSAQIESVLFIRTEGVKVSFLCKLLGKSDEEIRGALNELSDLLEGRGLKLLQSGDTCMLVTHDSMSDTLSSLFEEEVGGELSPASLQTLSIIAYKGTASRGEISYIRGVDSRMSLRNLTIRGLIEKAGTDSYKLTTDTLRHLGVGRVEELPRWKDIGEALLSEVSKRRGE
jgi:segregation and condensation protein B